MKARMSLYQIPNEFMSSPTANIKQGTVAAKEVPLPPKKRLSFFGATRESEKIL